MELDEFTLRLLVLFFPGVVAAYFLNALTIHKPRDMSVFLLQAFVLGLASYFLYWGILNLWAKASGGGGVEVYFLNALRDSKEKISYREVFWVVITSVGLGLALTAISTYKLEYKFAQKLRIARKFGDLDVWGFLMNSDPDWITVRDHSHNLIYDGWVHAFSDDSVNAELLLKDVSVYENGTGKRLYQVGAMYIARKREDITIEIRTMSVDQSVKWKEIKDEQGKQAPAA